MKKNQKTVVFLDETRVGTLAQNSNKIYFEYDTNFLKSAIEISPYKLPLKAGVQKCDNDIFDGLWGVFSDSLPDGWGRLLMDRHLMKLRINPALVSPLERLVYVGKYGMGALRYEPLKVIGEDFKKIVLDDLAESSQAILEGSNEDMLDELLSLGGSSAGARPKVLVQLSDNKKEIIHGKQKLQKGFSHWMVKFNSSQDAKDNSALEYVYHLLAKEAGLEMMPSALLEGKKGRYFATQRFDRVEDKKVHMHTVAGLVDADFRYPTLDYDDLMHLTLDLTKSYKEVEKMFRLACFNLFAHNRDDHAKNFSYLMGKDGKWRLSPAYDLTFSFGPGGEHSTMYLGEGKAPTRQCLMDLAKKHQLKNANEIMQEVAHGVSQYKKFAQEIGISQTISSTVDRTINKCY